MKQRNPGLAPGHVRVWGERVIHCEMKLPLIQLFLIRKIARRYQLNLKHAAQAGCRNLQRFTVFGDGTPRHYDSLLPQHAGQLTVG